MIYLDFEGELTGGAWSRPDVSTQGTYRATEWSSDRVAVILEGSQLVGEIDLRCIRPESGGVESWNLRMGNLD